MADKTRGKHVFNGTSARAECLLYVESLLTYPPLKRTTLSHRNVHYVSRPSEL